MAEPIKQDRGEAREEFVKEGMELNASGVAIMETGWVRMQQKVFTKWCNSQLKRGKLYFFSPSSLFSLSLSSLKGEKKISAGKATMEDLVEDMQTGIPLMMLT